MSKKKIAVLFVCLGNICRSPMAEAVFRKLISDKELNESFEIDSAGTSAYHEGENYHPETIKVCLEKGVELQGYSRKVRLEDFDDFDYIIAMDTDNYKELRTFVGSESGKKKVYRILRFSSRDLAGDYNVPDPYYGGPEGFVKVFELLEDSCSSLLAHIISDFENK